VSVAIKFLLIEKGWNSAFRANFGCQTRLVKFAVESVPRLMA
jgi:hypothetical protein